MTARRVAICLMIPTVLVLAWLLWAFPSQSTPPSRSVPIAPPDPATLPARRIEEMPPLSGAVSRHGAGRPSGSAVPEADASGLAEFTPQNRSPHNVGDPTITPETDPQTYLRRLQPVIDVGESLPVPTAESFTEIDDLVQNIGDPELSADAPD